MHHSLSQQEKIRSTSQEVAEFHGIEKIILSLKDHATDPCPL